MSEDRSRPLHLAVLAPNWLGDVVMASPLLSLLDGARDRTGARPRLTLAVRRRWSPLFATDPRCDELLPVARTGRHGGPLGVVRLARDLAARRPDALVLGPPSLRAALAARLAGVPRRVGYRGDLRAALLNPGLDREERGRRHHSEELLALGRAALTACGLEATEPADGQLLPGCASWAAASLGPGPDLWVLAPGTTYGEAKTWPVAQAAAFLALAVGEAGVRVALLGDAAARPFVDAMAAVGGLPWRRELAGAAGVVDLVGTTDLAAAVGVLKAARVFVGNDSGLMHVAGALGLSTLGIFGSSNPDWTAPLGPRTRTVVADGFACRPCYRRRCNQPRFCLDQVSAADVFAVAAEMRGVRALEGEP